MNRFDVAVLALRICGIYAWLKALELCLAGMLGTMLMTSYLLQRDLGFFRLVGLFSPVLIFAAAGFFLFARSQELAAKLLPPPTDVVPEQLAPHPLPSACVAFAVVGVAVFLFAVPGLISYAVTFASIEEPRVRTIRWTGDRAHIVANGAQLVLGFLLFTKARTFATAWWRKQARDSASVP